MRIRHYNIIIEVDTRNMVREDVAEKVETIINNDTVRNFIIINGEEHTLEDVKDCRALVSFEPIMRIVIKYRTYCHLSKDVDAIGDAIEKAFNDRKYAIRSNYNTTFDASFNPLEQVEQW